MTDASVWKSADLTRTYLDGVRAAIPGQAERLNALLRLINANGRPIQRFLDLGCGDGVLGRVLLDHYPDARGVFVDFSQPMLDAARAQVDARHALLALDYGDPAWVDAMRPFAPFDAIVSGFSIHHQPDARKRGVYAELFALLAPGGIFAHIEHVKSATAWGERLFEDQFVDNLVAHHNASSTKQSRETIAAAFYNRPDKAANLLAPVDLQLQWLRELGYADVDCFLKHYELALFAGRKPCANPRATGQCDDA